MSWSYAPMNIEALRNSGGISPFLDHVLNSPLADCFLFWCLQREEERPPLKRTIDPVKMPRRMLPYLFIYEAIEGRFRCRLAGTEIVAAFREDPTGKYLDELLPPSALEGRMRLFSGVIERATPVVYGGRLAAGPNRWMPFKRLLLPVSRTGIAADIVFGMVCFEQISQAKQPNLRNSGAFREFEAWASLEDLSSTDYNVAVSS